MFHLRLPFLLLLGVACGGEDTRQATSSAGTAVDDTGSSIGDTDGSEADSGTPDGEIGPPTEECEPDDRLCGEQSRRDLLAGRTLDVGEILLENDSDTLTITVQTEDGWRLDELHIHVADSDDGIPTTPGTDIPVPGRFRYKWEGLDVTEWVLEVPIEDIPVDVSCGDDLVIAVHAVVFSADDGGLWEESAWGCGRPAAGRNWAMLIDSSFVCCDPEPTCEKSSVQDVLDPAAGLFVGNGGPDQVLELGEGSIQGVIDAAADSNEDGYIILMVRQDETGEAGGTTDEAIEIRASYPQPFALIGCSVTLQDPAPDEGAPTARVAASAQSPGDYSIFVMDIHVDGSDGDGWVIEGDGRHLRNSRAQNSAGAGVRVLGDGNRIHNSPEISGNAVGVVLEGDDNLLSDCEIVSNVGLGVDVPGHRNSLEGNDVGAPNLGNGEGGIRITGDGDGDGGVTELDENVVEENGGVGIQITGAGHGLEGNESGDLEGGTGDNVGCEYEVSSGNYDEGGNEANGASVGSGGAFPTGCLGSD